MLLTNYSELHNQTSTITTTRLYNKRERSSIACLCVPYYWYWCPVLLLCNVSACIIFNFVWLCLCTAFGLDFPPVGGERCINT